MNQGFQVYDLPEPIRVGETYEAGLRTTVRGVLRRFIDTGDFYANFLPAEAINRDALALLSVQRKGSSFFLFLNYMDAHDPYIPPAPFDRMFGTVGSGWNEDEFQQLKRGFLNGNVKVPGDKSRMLATLYDRGIAYEDDQIGNLLRQLKQMNLYDNSLIIVTADHGEGFGDFRVMAHPGSVYQAHVGIPLVVKYPHQQKGQIVEEPVSQIDFLPTVLATAGIPQPANLPGIDLHGVEHTPSRDLLTVSYPCFAAIYPRFKRTLSGLVSGRMKYIESTTGSRELYDLARDPMELVNLYTEHGPEQASITTSLSRLLKAFPAYRGFESKANPEELRRIKGLGYVQ